MTERAFIDRQQVIRRDMLAGLCALRRNGECGFVRNLTHAMGYDPREAQFSLDYLVEAQCIKVTGNECRITAKGIDRYEEDLR